MAAVPQRELRNNVAEVLRRAEAGEDLNSVLLTHNVAEFAQFSDEVRVARPADVTR